MIHQRIEDASGLLVAIAMFDGIYKRVAEKAGVHPSMVSRVARGERNSPRVSVAIREELRVIRDYLNRSVHKSNGV
jgi:transcriptional regulator with XRE-family HTH domain